MVIIFIINIIVVIIVINQRHHQHQHHQHRRRHITIIITVMTVSAGRVQVNVLVDRGHSLGLTVRGGRDFGLGVYISGVDPYSVAENAGLKVRGP